MQKLEKNPINMLTFNDIPGLTGARNLNGYYHQFGKYLAHPEEREAAQHLFWSNAVSICEPGKKPTAEDFTETAKGVIAEAKLLGLTDIEVVFVSHDRNRVCIIYDMPLSVEERAEFPEDEVDDIIKTSSHTWTAQDTQPESPLGMLAITFSLTDRSHYIIFHEDDEIPSLYHVVSDNRETLDLQTALAEGVSALKDVYFDANSGRIVLEQYLECQFVDTDGGSFVPVLHNRRSDKILELPEVPCPEALKHKKKDIIMNAKISAFFKQYKDAIELAAALKQVLSEDEYIVIENGCLYMYFDE